MTLLNDTLSHDGLQKYVDTNTFGFCFDSRLYSSVWSLYIGKMY